jgi:hypothetical protein
LAGPDTIVILSRIFCCNSTKYKREISSVIYYL